MDAHPAVRILAGCAGLSLMTYPTDNCPFCRAPARTTWVNPPEWHTDEARQILRCACDADCGAMLLDFEDRHPRIDASLQDLLDAATPSERAFLSGSNRNWVDEVVYGPYLVQRLLEAQRAAAVAVDAFGFDDARVVGSAGGLDHANVLVVLDVGDRRFTIRVHGRDAEHNVVRSEAFWLESLAERARARVPEPVSGLDGRYVQRVESSDGARFCTAYRWIDGEMLATVGDHERTPRTIAAIGETLGTLHRHTQACLFPDWFARPRYGIARIRQRAEADPDILARFAALEKNPDAFGLVMHETGALSVILKDGHASLIDFRPFGWGYFLSDVAAIRRDLRPDERHVFLEAYRVTHALPDDYENLLSFFDSHWRTLR